MQIRLRDDCIVHAVICASATYKLGAHKIQQCTVHTDRNSVTDCDFTTTMDDWLRLITKLAYKFFVVAASCPTPIPRHHYICRTRVR